jgi:hypothetical protein
MAMLNIVSHEPERQKRKFDAAVKLVGDMLSGRKPSDAWREYKKTSDKIKQERGQDEIRKY